MLKHLINLANGENVSCSDCLNCCNCIYLQAGNKAKPSSPSSSSFHLEVAAALPELEFQKEARAGPFLVDLLIEMNAENGQTKENMNEINKEQAFHNEINHNRSARNANQAADASRPPGVPQKDAPSAYDAEHPLHNFDCEVKRKKSRKTETVPPLHQTGHVPKQPWVSSRRAEREIRFSVD